MTRCTWTICRLLVCGLIGCCLAVPAAASPAEEKPRAGAQGEPAMDPEMAAYMKYATPAAEHKALEALAGSWKTVTKMWSGPGEPQVSEGSARTSMILGGRFLKEEFSGDFMGEVFEGFGITGYDTMKKQYVGTWVDTMGTGIVTSKGSYDPAGRQFNSTASYTDPMTMKEKTWKMMNRIVDDNKHVFSMYEMREGKEVMTMEITYTRK